MTTVREDKSLEQLRDDVLRLTQQGILRQAIARDLIKEIDLKIAARDIGTPGEGEG